MLDFFRTSLYPNRLDTQKASVLFLWLTFLVSLFHSFIDDFRVIGPAYPILARVGEDALLTCRLFPKRTAMHMEVRWYHSEPGTSVIAHWDGVEVTQMQVEEYRDRIELINDSIAEGKVTLKIHNIQPSDNGQYWCHFQEGNYHGETSVLLEVASEYMGKDRSWREKYINVW